MLRMEERSGWRFAPGTGFLSPDNGGTEGGDALWAEG